MLQHPQRVGPDLHTLCCSKPTLTNFDTASNRCACHQLGNTAPLLFAASPPFASGSPPTLASSAATAQVCCHGLLQGAVTVPAPVYDIKSPIWRRAAALLGIQWGGLQPEPELLRRQPSRLILDALHWPRTQTSCSSCCCKVAAYGFVTAAAVAGQSRRHLPWSARVCHTAGTAGLRLRSGGLRWPPTHLGVMPWPAQERRAAGKATSRGRRRVLNCWIGCHLPDWPNISGWGTPNDPDLPKIPIFMLIYFKIIACFPNGPNPFKLGISCKFEINHLIFK
jgi:hypothetical protein